MLITIQIMSKEDGQPTKLTPAAINPAAIAFIKELHPDAYQVELLNGSRLLVDARSYLNILDHS